MRTKTLLLSAVALAAGIFTSQAQSNVYSANIVGYVNSTLSNNFVLVATPLDNYGSNDLASLLPNLPSKSSVQVWNGSGYTPAAKGSGTSWSPDLVVPPGTGFFVKLSTAVFVTNPFTGQVTNNISITNNLTGGLFALVGSPIPYSDDLNDPSNYLGLASMPAKSSIQVYNGSGYTPSAKSGGATWSPDLTINAGQGFFIKPTSSTNWVQTLHVQ